MNESKNITIDDEKGSAKTERIPIYQKMTLTIRESAEYSNIGINKIDSMLKQPGGPFVLYIWNTKIG